MNKRGQLTIFVIIAILVVAVVALFFVFRDNLSGGESSGQDLDANEVYEFIESCMYELAEKTIYDIGKGGGYSAFEDNLDWDMYTSSLESYYIIDRYNFMPSKSKVESEIEKHFKRNFYVCSNEFSKFREYEIEEGNLNVEARILENRVDFEIYYPLAVRKGENSLIINDFNFEVDSRLNLIYDFVYEFIQEQGRDLRALCLSCIPEEVEEEYLFVDILENEEGTRISFIDFTQELNDEPFVWVFVNKY